MTFDEMLEIVVEQTGHTRFLWLCSTDNPDVAGREGYRRAVESIALDESPEVMAVDDGSFRARDLIRRCAFRSRPSCGCGTGLCALKGGREVVTFECVSCVERYGF